MTPSLTYVQPLFLEHQRAPAVFPRASRLIASIAILMLVAAAVVRVRAPWHAAMAILPGLLIAASVVAIAAILMMYSTGTTIVETTMIQLRLSVFGWRVWSRTIPFHQVHRADLTNMTGQISVLKHGIGELRFMTRKTCVRLHLPEFNYVMIGSATPQELLEAIESALREPGASQIVSSN